MKKILTLVLCMAWLSAFSQDDTIQQIIPGRKNGKEQQNKPYVILISADGFRYDYAQKYHAEHLLELSGSGVQATSMIPSFPSVTFPNHYSMVTGLYPSHEGLVNNRFYDRDHREFYSYKGKTALNGMWYGGTPLWVLAEQQHLISASFYWVGSEAAIKGIYPTYYYHYNEKIEIHQRIKAVVDWLSLPVETRPHLITFYFPQVDHEGHKHGPDSREVATAVHLVDSSVYELTKAVKTTGLDVNFIFVSDHGMTSPDIAHPLKVPVAIDTTKYIVSGDGILVELYAKDKSNIEKTYEDLKKEAKGFNVYLRINVPKHMHYAKSDDWHNRIGDILLIPKWPNVFNLYNRKPDPGWHGYDPMEVKDMHATFYAWGPAFKKHLKIPAFQNVDIYPLITQILVLNYTDKIDGTGHLAHEVLLKQ